MNKLWTKFALAVLALAVLAPAGWAQMATVKGMAKDADGKPLQGGVVQLVSKDTGRKYEVKTDKKGEFFSLGIASGTYRINLLKDGQIVYYLENVPVRLGSD